MLANSQSNTDNDIVKAAIKSLLYHVNQVQSKEKHYAATGVIPVDKCALLESSFAAVNYYALLLKTNYGIDTTMCTEDLVPVPSKFNKFSTQAYLSLLKDKYAN